MAFDKSKQSPDHGKRGKGKATILAREAIAKFVDGNAHRLEGWLDQIAETEGPKAAFECFCDVVEYHVPKLARTELSNPDGSNLTIEVIRFADKPASK